MENEFQDLTKEYNELRIDIFKAQMKAEEGCVSKVLKAYLNRTPTDEDFKKCIKLSEDKGKPLNYILAYEATKLGRISHSTIDTETGGIKFVVNFNILP